jgi:Cys-tRNA(Pro)/Cys-tRNA(Cys) deacylase
MPQAATPALALLARAGVPHRVRAYELPPREGRDRAARPNYGLEAAAALGVAPERVFKTLIATVDDRLAVAIVPVAGELDLKALAASLGGRRAALADGPAAERASGSVVGGISPLALRRPLPTAIDRSVTAHETVLVSAGRRGLQVELAPADLTALTNAVVADLVKRG